LVPANNVQGGLYFNSGVSIMVREAWIGVLGVHEWVACEGGLNSAKNHKLSCWGMVSANNIMQGSLYFGSGVSIRVRETGVWVLGACKWVVCKKVGVKVE
jgi:hypothetical protein